MSVEPTSPSDAPLPAAPVAIDYASPLDDATPRPTVALWVAAGIVWAVALAPAAALVWKMTRSLARGDRDGWLLLIPIAICVGVALAEWRVVARRSDLCAMLVGLPSAAIAAGVAIIATVAFVGWAFEPNRRFAAMVVGLGYAIALLAPSGLVATTHLRWAERLIDDRRYRANAGTRRGTI